TYKLLYPHLEKSLQHSIEQNDFDFLYGASGKINLLINTDNDYLTKDIFNLFITSIDKYYSITKKYNELPKRINIGTAHGMASILKTLSEIYINEHKTKKLEVLINTLIDFYLDIVLDHPYISFGDYYYPKTKEVKGSGMFAWCYGDLGIVYSLLHASSAIGRKKDAIIPLVKKLTKRNIQNTGLIELDDYHFRSKEHTTELQSRFDHVCRLLLEKKKK